MSLQTVIGWKQHDVFEKLQFEMTLFTRQFWMRLAQDPAKDLHVRKPAQYWFFHELCAVESISPSAVAPDSQHRSILA